MPEIASRFWAAMRMGPRRKPSTESDKASVKSGASGSASIRSRKLFPLRPSNDRKTSSMIPTTSRRASTDVEEKPREEQIAPQIEDPEPLEVYGTPQAIEHEPIFAAVPEVDSSEGPSYVETVPASSQPLDVPAQGQPEEQLAEAAVEEEISVKTIVVLGATGTGKTSLINLASGQELPVGNGLHSCTHEIQATEPFKLNDCWYRLIDTPGFGDDRLPDSNVLKLVADFLAVMYEKGDNVTAVLYLHRMSDIRMGSSGIRNLKMLTQMCGESAMKHVGIVAAFCGKEDIASTREAELLEDPTFFGSALEHGATAHRHDNTVDSATSIIETFAKHSPVGLAIQQEMVDMKLDLAMTSAGHEFDREMAERRTVQEQVLKSLKQDMENAISKQGEEDRLAIISETNALRARIEQLRTLFCSGALGFMFLLLFVSLKH